MRMILVGILILLSACFSETSDEKTNVSENETEARSALKQKESTVIEPDEEQLTLASNLDVPWSIAKNEDHFYVTERAGGLLKIEPDGNVVQQELNLTKEVFQIGEGGLLGFVFDPNDSNNEEAFLYHTYQEGNQVYNRVVRVRQNENQWEEVDVLLEKIPGAQFHNGGRLEIGPDDKLYITTGDAVVRSNSQNLNSLAGKILRMNLDGSIPSDNPFSNSYVYSYGHRNPQGMTWAEDGTMYSTEHGSQAHDEVNLIEAGQNYGWPTIQGDQERQGMEKPIYHTGQSTWAPSGIDFYNGKIYIAALAGSKIIAFNPENSSAEIFYEGSGRMRDIWIEDGYLYTITSNRDGRGNPDTNDDQLIRLKLN